LTPGPPPAGADAAFPPTAKIQLPIRVRVRIQVEMPTNSSHHSTVICTRTEPRLKLEAKIACSVV
jgi:hypothetical protein